MDEQLTNCKWIQSSDWSGLSNGLHKPRMLSAGYPLRSMGGTNSKPGKLPNCPKGVRTATLAPHCVRCSAGERPTTTAPTHFVGDPVHTYPGALSGRCVSWRDISFIFRFRTHYEQACKNTSEKCETYNAHDPDDTICMMHIVRNKNK